MDENYIPLLAAACIVLAAAVIIIPALLRTEREWNEYGFEKPIGDGYYFRCNGSVLYLRQFLFWFQVYIASGNPPAGVTMHNGLHRRTFFWIGAMRDSDAENRILSLYRQE